MILLVLIPEYSDGSEEARESNCRKLATNNANECRTPAKELEPNGEKVNARSKAEPAKVGGWRWNLSQGRYKTEEKYTVFNSGTKA